MIVIKNKPEMMVEEMIDGYVKSNPGLFHRIPGTRAIATKGEKDRVLILAGGGAGCEPMYIGYAGIGMADAVVCGNVFAAPSATMIYRAIRHLNPEKGVLLITGNYIGDVLNYELTCELCGYDGIEAKTVYVKDDILHYPENDKELRRGIGGIMSIIKLAAGAAQENLSLKEIKRIAQKGADLIGTVSVTFWPGYRPETGIPMYEMENGKIEFGMGFNGEPGKEKMEMPSADDLAKKILDTIMQSLNLKTGDEAMVILNGKGATSLMELNVLANSILNYLEVCGIHVFHMETGNFFTAPGMGGVSVTMLKLDEELKRYYHKDSWTPMYSYRTI